jgi:hypothetical protein
MASRQTNGSKRNKVEAEAESKKQRSKKQNEKHGNEACTETRWRQVQRFSSALPV